MIKLSRRSFFATLVFPFIPFKQYPAQVPAVAPSDLTARYLHHRRIISLRDFLSNWLVKFSDIKVTETCSVVKWIHKKNHFKLAPYKERFLNSKQIHVIISPTQCCLITQEELWDIIENSLLNNEFDIMEAKLFQYYSRRIVRY